MDRDQAPVSPLLPRRELLRVGALGMTALGFIGIAPIASAVQNTPMSQADRDRAALGDGNDPRTFATNEKEWRANLGQLGTLSLMSAEMALQKGVNPDVKQFANFEATEQRTVGQVLAEMGTPPPSLDARSRAAVEMHKQAEGAEFDKVFARAQLETHQKLLALQQSFLANTERATQSWTKHARHLSMLIMATVTEHIAHCEALVAEVGA